MDYTIRPAVRGDHEYIASWTRETFSWGDYVADRFIEWFEDPHTEVIVADVGGKAVSLGRIQMVSETEAWSSAMRVHPEYRRGGIGSAVAEALWEWARDAGARIVRLAVEHWNTAARGQVTKAGFRPLGDWLWAQRGVGDASPVPEGNGGIRVKGAEALKPAHSAEAEPALLSWTDSELAHAAHGLFPMGWTWRRLSVDHLVAAAQNRSLWEGRPGWAVAELNGDRFDVHWVETNREDARAMVRALVERGADAGADRIRVMMPHVDWLVQAFRRAGFETGGITVFGLAL
ncbi:MAG: GNAT family N-acetyltransferase [Acidimicrobiia bacterium]